MGKRVDLAKEELLTVEGKIDEIYPDGRFGVMLENGYRIIAYTAGKMRRFRIRTVVGDNVHVEMTPYDLSKGRIVFRERTPGQGPGTGPRKRGAFRR
jgi:translation initiation factor IF-1